MSGMKRPKPFRFDNSIVGMLHDGTSVLAPKTGAAVRFEGFTIGCYSMTIDLRSGDAFIVPQNTWHRVVIHEPCQLVFVTPGPRSEHRGLRDRRG